MPVYCPACSNVTDVIELVPPSSLRRLWEEQIGITELKLPDIIKRRKCPACGLVHFDPLRSLEGDAKFYDDLVNLTRDYIFPSGKEEFKFIGSRVHGSSRLLDVGCGNGNLFDSLELPVSNYVGIDFSPVSCALGVEKGLNLQCETLERHSRGHKGAYEVIVLSHVLEHVADPLNFVWSAENCLANIGSIFVTVPNGNSYLKHHTNGYFNLPPNHLTMWTEKALDKLFSRIGMVKYEVFRERIQDCHRQDYAEAWLHSFGFLCSSPALSSSAYAQNVKKYAKYLAKLVPSFATGHSITIHYRRNRGWT